MELSPVTGQAFSFMGPQPDTLAYLVDLLSREILEVGVAGHDSQWKLDRPVYQAPWHAINSATTHTDYGVVVQSMCMSNNAMRGNT